MLTHIVLLGPPGCGKGTLAKSLNKKFNIPILGLGDIVRKEIKSNSSMGIQFNSYVNEGKLVPDPLIIKLFSVNILPTHFKSGVIIDGYPRTIAQAQSLFDLFNKKSINLKILYFLTTYDVIKERIIGRISCSKCNLIYHNKFKPPLNNNICDLCNSILSTRSDDSTSVIETRYKTYLNEITPVIDLFSDNVIHINADPSPNLVLKSVINVL